MIARNIDKAGEFLDKIAELEQTEEFITSNDVNDIESEFKGIPMIGIALGFPGKAGDNVEAEYLYNKIKIDQILAEEGEEDIDEDDLYMEED